MNENIPLEKSTEGTAHFYRRAVPQEAMPKHIVTKSQAGLMLGDDGEEGEATFLLLYRPRTRPHYGPTYLIIFYIECQVIKFTLEIQLLLKREYRPFIHCIVYQCDNVGLKVILFKASTTLIRAHSC